MAKLIFPESGLPKIVSDAGPNFTSEMFKEFCRNMIILQSISSSYHHQINGGVETCITYVKCTIKKSRSQSSSTADMVNDCRCGAPHPHHNAFQ